MRITTLSESEYQQLIGMLSSKNPDDVEYGMDIANSLEDNTSLRDELLSKNIFRKSMIIDIDSIFPKDEFINNKTRSCILLIQKIYNEKNLV